MKIIENIAQIYEDEKQTKIVQVKSWEISGIAWPREKNLPVRLVMSGVPTIYMNCSHQDADVFLAFPISLWAWLRLKWYRVRW